MSARELKAQLHERIDALTDEQTVQVYEFVNSQIGDDPIPTSEEMIDELRGDLEEAEKTNYAGITTSELQQKMKQWLTR